MSTRLHLARSPEEPDAAANAHIRVLLADDHAPMRRCLRLLLDGEEGIEVIAEANDLAAVTRHVDTHEPQVLILDLSMPDGSSIEAIDRLRERAPDTQIVVMTMEENPVFAQRAFAAGAVGFVAKDLADGELAQAIRAAARGEEFVSPRVAQRLRASRVRTPPARRNLTALPDRREASAGTL
jgi:two-component system response regulator NreC